MFNAKLKQIIDSLSRWVLFCSPQFKILDSIIRPNTVFMVDHFKFIKLSTKMRFHYVPMFGVLPSVKPYITAAMAFIDPPAFPVKVIFTYYGFRVTFPIAKNILKLTPFKVARMFGNHLAACLAWIQLSSAFPRTGLVAV